MFSRDDTSKRVFFGTDIFENIRFRRPPLVRPCFNTETSRVLQRANTDATSKRHSFGAVIIPINCMLKKTCPMSGHALPTRDKPHATAGQSANTMTQASVNSISAAKTLVTDDQDRCQAIRFNTRQAARHSRAERKCDATARDTPRLRAGKEQMKCDKSMRWLAHLEHVYHLVHKEVHDGLGHQILRRRGGRQV